jgi:hypothetical protein
MPSGSTYGNVFLLPLIAGSGGGGTTFWGIGGAGGGGAILIAASQLLIVDGTVAANGAAGQSSPVLGSSGSGGSVRLVANVISGNGHISAAGGQTQGYSQRSEGGAGRIRFDCYQNSFGGTTAGLFSHGFQPIIIPAAGDGIQLGIQSLAGVVVPASPSGVIANPDVIIPAQHSNPIPVVVRCTNLPLNTQISVVVRPVTGAQVEAVGLNNAGTTASSTANISLNMPRGGGIIYAKAVTGVAGGTASADSGVENRSLAETGWTTDGERFKEMEITAELGGQQRIAYITESGERYEAH